MILSDQKGSNFSFKLYGNELAIINNCNITFSQKDSEFIRQHAATMKHGGGLAGCYATGGDYVASVISCQVPKQSERVGGSKSAVDSYGGDGEYDDLTPLAQKKNEAFNESLKPEATKSEEANRDVRHNSPSWVKYDRLESIRKVSVSAEVVPKTLDKILQERISYLKENTSSKSL